MYTSYTHPPPKHPPHYPTIHPTFPLPSPSTHHQLHLPHTSPRFPFNFPHQKPATFPQSPPRHRKITTQNSTRPSPAHDSFCSSHTCSINQMWLSNINPGPLALFNAHKGPPGLLHWKHSCKFIQLHTAQLHSWAPMNTTVTYSSHSPSCMKKSLETIENPARLVFGLRFRITAG